MMPPANHTSYLSFGTSDASTWAMWALMARELVILLESLS